MERDGLFPIWDGRHELANFAAVPVSMYSHNLVPTSEHAYQALKFSPAYPEIVQAIECTLTPLEAKKIAQENSDLVRADWEDSRCLKMAVVIRRKLRQNPKLQEELLRTNNKYIYEDADQYAPPDPTDKEIAELRRWGVYKGEGENWIGEILMSFRDQLQSGEKL